MRCQCLFFLLIASAVAASEVRALPDPLPECYSAWLFFGQNFERGDDPGQALLQAQQAFDDYRLEMARLDIDTLDLGVLQGRIESATSLAGPKDSPAGYFRQYLENTVRQHSKKVWPENVLKRPCALVDAVVHFPDETAVTLEAEAAHRDFQSGNFVGFDYRVDEDSVTDVNGKPESQACHHVPGTYTGGRLLLIQSEVLPHSACLSARVARRRREVCSWAYIERRQRSSHAPRGKPFGGSGRIRLRR